MAVGYPYIVTFLDATLRPQVPFAKYILLQWFSGNSFCPNLPKSTGNGIPRPTSEQARRAPSLRLRSIVQGGLQAGLLFSPCSDGGIFTQAEFWREDSKTPEMKRTPSTPSSTLGTSSDAGIGARRAFRAAICSAKSA